VRAYQTIKCLILIVFLATVLSTGTMAYELVVIGSSSLRIKVGKILENTQIINLSRDEFLKLISYNGELLELKGPYSGVIDTKKDAAKPSTGKRFLDLFGRLLGNSDKFDDSSIGALIKTLPNYEPRRRGQMLSVGRNLALPNTSDPWAIDVERSGAHCVKEKSVNFWRTKSRKSARFSVLTMPKGSKVRVKWPKRTELLKWPGSVPLTDGAAYQIKVSGNPFQSINIHVAPLDLPTPVHSAAWMVGKGCMEQAGVLLKSLLR
jgi:hypothetical protein